MTRSSDAEAANRLVRRRARMMPALAILFIVQQGSYFSGTRMDEGHRLVNHLAISGWVVMTTVLLVGLATGGGWLRGAQVRALANDEGTRANRAAALSLGFVATMVGAIALYLLSLFEPVGVREAIHVLVTIGIAAALLRFAVLERRALKDG